MTPEELEEKIAVAIYGDEWELEHPMFQKKYYEKARRVIKVIREYLTIPHNHPTREIREPGACPGCDSYWHTQAEKEKNNG